MTNMNVYTEASATQQTLLESQGPRQVPREHAEYFLSIVRHKNAKQRYH